MWIDLWSGNNINVIGSSVWKQDKENSFAITKFLGGNQLFEK